MNYEFIVDTDELLASEEFKNDHITKAIDNLNDELSFLKCRGIILEVKSEFQETEQLVNLNGFIVRSYTIAKLINKGIVKLKEAKQEISVDVSKIAIADITPSSTVVFESQGLRKQSDLRALEEKYSKILNCNVAFVQQAELKAVINK